MCLAIYIANDAAFMAETAVDPDRATLSRDGISGSACSDSAGAKQCRLLSTSIWEAGDRFLPNKAKKYFVFNGSDAEGFAGGDVCLNATFS